MQHMLYDTDDRVAVITLNRPDKANAVSGLTLNEMDECFTRAADDADVRVIVLRSVGKHFCAGHDLSGSDEAWRRLRQERAARPRAASWTGRNGAWKPSTSGRRSTTSATAAAGATSPSPPSRRCRASASPGD